MVNFEYILSNFQYIKVGLSPSEEIVLFISIKAL